MKEIHVVRAMDLSLTRPLRFAYARMASEKHPPKRIFHINYLSVCLGSVCLGPVCLAPCVPGPCIVIIPVWASAYVVAYVNSFLGLRFCLRFGPSVYKKFPRTYNLLKGGFFS